MNKKLLKKLLTALAAHRAQAEKDQKYCNLADVNEKVLDNLFESDSARSNRYVIAQFLHALYLADETASSRADVIHMAIILVSTKSGITPELKKMFAKQYKNDAVRELVKDWWLEKETEIMGKQFMCMMLGVQNVSKTDLLYCTMECTMCEVLRDEDESWREAESMIKVSCKLFHS